MNQRPVENNQPPVENNQKVYNIPHFTVLEEDLHKLNNYIDMRDDIDIRNDMAKRENEQQKFRAELQCKGHTCIQILESYPSRTRWCNQEVCILSKK